MLFSVLGLSIPLQQTYAQVYQAWRSEATSGSWQGSANWWKGSAGPIEFGQQEWNNNHYLNQTNSNGGNTFNTWRWLFQSGASSAHTFSGDAVRFFQFDLTSADPAIINQSSATHIINNNIEGDGDSGDPLSILIEGSGGLTFGGTANNQGSAINVQSSGGSPGAVTFNGTISGSGALNSSHTGTLVLSASNSYSGATDISNGVALIAESAALGATNSGTTIRSGASLRLSNSIAVSGEALTLNGTGLAGDGSGALRSVHGTNSYVGTITLSGGNTYLGAATNSLLTISNVSSGGNQLWVVGDGTTVLAGSVSGSPANAFVKTNTGTAVLMASNAWGGDEFIREGTVVLSNNNALGVGGTTFLGALGGSLASSLRIGQGITNSNSITVEGGGTGTRSVTYTEASGTGSQLGSLTLNTNSMAFNVASGGTLNFSGAVSTLGTARLSVDGGGTVISAGNSTSATSDNYQVRIGNGTLIIGGGTLIARTNVAGLGHAIDLGVDLNGSIVNAASRLYASNGVTISNSIFVSTTNNQARVIGQQDMASASTATYSGPIGLTNVSLTVEAGTNSAVTVSGAITNFAGSGNGLIKTGAGTAILTAANSYDGTTTISNGALRIANASALGSSAGGTVVDAGAALEFSNNVNVVGEALTISGDGVGGNGALRNVSGANTNTGSLTLGAGSRIQAEASTTLLQSGSVALGANTLTLGGAGSTIISGAVTGTGGVTKTDSGAATLNNNGNNFGLLTLNGGTLIATNNTRVTGVAGAGGSTLHLDNPDEATKQFIVDGAGTNTFAGVITGTSQIVKRGTGMQVFTGTNSNTSGIYIDGGSVNLQGTAAVVASGLIDIGTRVFADRLGDSAELRLGGADGGRTFTNNLGVWTNTGSATRVLASENTGGVNTWAGNITNIATNNGGFVVSNATGGSLLVSGTVSGSGNLTKVGDGGLILSGSNTYSGTTTLSNGTLTAAHSHALGTGALLQASGASTLRLSNSVTVTNAMSVYNVAFSGSGSDLAGVITNNNTTYDVAGGETNSITGYLTGAGGVTKIGDGGLIIAGTSNNTYTGATVVNGGSLILSNSAGNAINNSSGISVNGAGSSLVLGNSNMIGDGIALTLDGGTFITGSAAAGYAETLGTLTLSSTSTIDFGSWAGGGGGSRYINLADSSAISWAAGTLILTNWVQMTNSQSGEYARLYFGNSASGLTSGQLSQIKFHFGDGIYDATILSSGEVVPLNPIPEPRVYLAMAVLVAAIVWRERRRWWRGALRPRV